MSCKFKDLTKGDGIHPSCYVTNGECQFLNEPYDTQCHILNAYTNLKILPKENAYLDIDNKIAFDFGTYTINNNTRMIFEGKIISQYAEYPSLFGCSDLTFSMSSNKANRNFVKRNNVRIDTNFIISNRTIIEIGREIKINNNKFHDYGIQTFSNDQPIRLCRTANLSIRCWHFALYNNDTPLFDVYPFNKNGIATFKDANTGIIYMPLDGSSVTYGISAT